MPPTRPTTSPSYPEKALCQVMDELARDKVALA
jgi:hypothetical protein